MTKYTSYGPMPEDTFESIDSGKPDTPVLRVRCTRCDANTIILPEDVPIKLIWWNTGLKRRATEKEVLQRQTAVSSTFAREHLCPDLADWWKRYRDTDRWIYRDGNDAPADVAEEVQRLLGL